MEQAQAFANPSSSSSSSNDYYDDSYSPPSSSYYSSAPRTQNTSVVYTDGASRGNGYRGASAGYGVYWGDNDARNISAPLEGERQTNQRAEATAIRTALEQSQDLDGRLEVRTDSQYCAKAMNEWKDGWQQNGWKTSSGGDVKNRDILEPMVDLVNSRKGETDFVYVPGHQGDYGNEQADALATAGADSRRYK